MSDSISGSEALELQPEHNDRRFAEQISALAAIDSGLPHAGEPVPTPVAVADTVWETADVLVPARRPPGPGVFEAFGWTIGAGFAHVAGALAITLLLLCVHIANHGMGGGNQMAQFADLLLHEYAVALVGGDQALFLLAVVVAVTLRMRSSATRRLGWRLPTATQTVLVVGLTLPLNVLCTAVYMGALAVWKWVTVYLPALSYLDNFLSMEAIKPVAQHASLPVLILMIAVLPALSEELLFRGLIGRGLVARWGVLRGILLTSILFGMIHIHPAHAIAVIPLGIALHLVYYATRSFWAPVLLHFCNNAWAAYNAKLGAAPEVDTVLVAALLLATAVAAVIAVLWLLLKMRVEYTRVDGSVWDPGYPTLETPREAISRSVPGLPSRLVVGPCLGSGLAFGVVFASWWTGM